MNRRFGVVLLPGPGRPFGARSASASLVAALSFFRPLVPRPLRLSPLEWEIGARSSCLPVRGEIGGTGPCEAATPPLYHHHLPVDRGSVMTHRRDRPASTLYHLTTFFLFFFWKGCRSPLAGHVCLVPVPTAWAGG